MQSLPNGEFCQIFPTNYNLDAIMKLKQLEQKMMKSLLILLFLASPFLGAKAEDIVDITDRFTNCWGRTESVTHHDDGTMTFNSEQGGGLVFKVGDEDWTEYSHLVFELAEPSSCNLRPRVLYAGETRSDDGFMDTGQSKASVELSITKREHVRSAVLQADGQATLFIRRAYLVKEAEFGEQKGQLRINELMQSNVDCIMDDLNDFPDSWVELHNSGPTPVNLARYRLGLTANADSAWQLPSQTIVGPGAFAVVYCDKVGNKLHTDFRLDSGKGASVYLFFNKEVDDKVTGLKKQPAPNIAYGRSTEQGDEWGYQYVPTPGAANCGKLCTTILKEPVFSEQGKVLTSDTTLLLRLSLPTGSPKGTVIRYTTDLTHHHRQHDDGQGQAVLRRIPLTKEHHAIVYLFRP